MVSKVNLKARINRHSRILKNNLWTIHPFRSFYYRWNYNIVLFLVIFLFPVYPLFSAFVTDTTQYSFERTNLDESSIIDSYEESEGSTSENIDNIEEIISENENLFDSDSFLSINSIIDSEQRDLSNHTQVIDYEVKLWDSFSTIAYKFGISKNSIYWANNFKSSKVLHPWDKIKIPPVSWVIHKIEKWDTLLAISKKYKVDQDKIISQNWLTIDSNLIAWKDLIIPWAIKIIEKPVIVPSKTIAKTKSNTSVILANSSTTWEYKLVKRTPKRKFYWWNCTRYVAQYKNVDWNWNAKDWLKNAKANWYPTGSTATKWSIIVLHGRGYNPYYGHVWIVVNVVGNDIIVKDMNYRKLNEVTTRKISKNDSAIKWYIYVD